MKNIFLFLLVLSFYNCTTALNLRKYDNVKTSIASLKLIEPPYEINGNWYFPYDYDEFTEIGIASRIKDLKSGDKTKNGEVFHADVSTGSHRSLGLASNVRVTNIENGRSMIVRVNHRGAYSNTNIIELSDVVFNKLDLKDDGNLIKIRLISDNETFILGEAKTYNAEKKILTNAPINGVSIIDIDSGNPTENLENIEKSINDDVNLDGFRLETDIINKNIYIHVATLLFRKNADVLLSNLSSINKVGIVRSMVNGKNRFKVIIGPFDDLTQLNRVLKIDTIQQYEDLSIFLK